jgi:uncharacterized PurR-regulated membrane protein YhhQ (DUF165 family)
MRRLYVVVVMVFASLAVLSPVLGTKVVDLAGIKFTAGIFTMLLAYSLLDVVNELWGKADARFLAAGIVWRSSSASSRSSSAGRPTWSRPDMPVSCG